MSSCILRYPNGLMCLMRMSCPGPADYLKGVCQCFLKHTVLVFKWFILIQSKKKKTNQKKNVSLKENCKLQTPLFSSEVRRQLASRERLQRDFSLSKTRISGYRKISYFLEILSLMCWIEPSFQFLGFKWSDIVLKICSFVVTNRAQKCKMICQFVVSNTAGKCSNV